MAIVIPKLLSIPLSSFKVTNIPLQLLALRSCTQVEQGSWLLTRMLASYSSWFQLSACIPSIILGSIAMKVSFRLQCDPLSWQAQAGKLAGRPLDVLPLSSLLPKGLSWRSPISQGSHVSIRQRGCICSVCWLTSHIISLGVYWKSVRAQNVSTQPLFHHPPLLGKDFILSSPRDSFLTGCGKSSLISEQRNSISTTNLYAEFCSVNLSLLFPA